MPPRNGATQKPKNTKGTLIRLGKYLFHSGPLLIFALTLSIVGNCLALVGPSLCGKAIDAVSGGKGKVDFDTVFYYAAWMAGFYVLSAALGLPGTPDCAAYQPENRAYDAWGAF